MSLHYVKAILDALPALTSTTDAFVLVAIAEYTSDETLLAWPSIAALMRRTRLSRRAVIYAVRRLEARGLVSTTIGGNVDGDNRASCYRLEFDRRGRALTLKEPAKRPARRVNSPVPAPAAVRSTAPPPEPRSVPNPRPKKIPSAAPAVVDLEAEKQRQLDALRKKLTV